MKLWISQLVLAWIAIIFACGSTANKAEADIVITASASGGGGVTLSASGQIDTSSLNWIFDEPASGGGLNMNASFLSGYPDGLPYEMFADGEYSRPGPADLSWDTFDGGSFDRGFLLQNARFAIVGAGATNDGAAPAAGIYAFDFTITDVDGSLADYTEGVVWDSNGFGNAGGEMVTLVVSSVPEPSSFLVMCPIVVGMAVRRRRRAKP